MAREVVEKYGDDIGAHPVGTGPWRLVFWKRGSKMVFERNPGYREEYYEADPAADDPVSQAILARNKGKRLPMVDRVEVSIIEQDQPRWLSFLNGEADLIDRVPEAFMLKSHHSCANTRAARSGPSRFQYRPPTTVILDRMLFM